MLRFISHVQLPVPDVAQAVEWYTAHLGFTLEVHHAQVDALLNLDSGPTLFLWQTQDAIKPFTVNGQPFPTLGVEVSGLAALHDQLAAAGTTVPEVEDTPSGWIMRFFDPYGNMWIACEDHPLPQNGSA